MVILSALTTEIKLRKPGRKRGGVNSVIKQNTFNSPKGVTEINLLHLYAGN